MTLPDQSKNLLMTCCNGMQENTQTVSQTANIPQSMPQMRFLSFLNLYLNWTSTTSSPCFTVEPALIGLAFLILPG